MQTEGKFHKEQNAFFTLIKRFSCNYFPTVINYLLCLSQCRRNNPLQFSFSKEITEMTQLPCARASLSPELCSIAGHKMLTADRGHNSCIR